MMRATPLTLRPNSAVAKRLINKQSFFVKRSKAGTKRIWERPSETVEGTLDIAPNFDVLDVAENPSVFDPSSPNYNPNIPVPPPAPLSLPSDYSVFHSKIRALREPQSSSFPSASMGGGRGGVTPSSTSSRAELLRKLNRNEIDIGSVAAAERQLKRNAFEEDVFYGKAPNPVDARVAEIERLEKEEEHARSLNEFAQNEKERRTTEDAHDAHDLREGSSYEAYGEEIEGGGRSAAVVGPSLTLTEQLQQEYVRPSGGDAVMAASLNASRSTSVGAFSPSTSVPVVPIATIPFGQQLKVDLESVTTHSSPVPAALDHIARSKEHKAESVKMPRSLNKLFHKIMGWNDQLAEMKMDTALRGGVASAGSSVPFGGEDDGALRPQLEPTSQVARQEFKKMSEKLRYGALLEEYDKDQFALENKLNLAGLAFEKKFTDWASIQIVDNAAQQEMEDMNRNKASMLLHTDMDFKIPKLGHDCCNGCGSTFQSSNKDVYGYVKPGRVERYIQNHSEKVKRRCEYGDRMAELQEHWEKNGRRVGEEWLDFMTQDEFDAIYKYIPRPMVCDRCSVLNTKRTSLLSTSLMTAPDFQKELRPLREKRCVVVLVCDITDFPGSMVYDLPALISMNNPVILVLNKLDCIQQRRPGYKGAARILANQQVPESYIRQWAKEIATQFRLPAHRIKAIVPVSARRGWNIDVLIENIEQLSNMNLTKVHAPILPTYFVGVSNVGKSSIINAVAHHLYVPQPPHPLSKRIYYTKRDQHGKESVHWRWYTPPNAHRSEMLVSKSNKMNKKSTELLTVSNLPGTTIATTGVKISLSGDDKGASSTKLFDTPGLHPHWQATSPLSILDVRRSLQFNFRNPEVFVIKQGASLLFAGVAAIDVVKASVNVMFCVYSSRKAGHAIINTDRSDAFWAEQLGKKIGPPMAIEQIGDLRLTTQKSYLFECYGKHKMRPKADIYICGMGWVSFFTSEADDIVLRVRTLPGIVHGVREPLRVNDISCRKKWPILRSEQKIGDKRIPRINKIIKLTNTEVDLTQDPIKPIGRTIAKTYAPASDKPFDDVMEELSALGKL